MNKVNMISSRENRWIKLALQLKHHKFRKQYHQFLMEGYRSALDTAAQQIRDVICFFDPKWMEKEEWKDLQEKGSSLHWLFLSTDSSLIRLISDTVHGQGIVLIVKMPSPLDWKQKKDWNGVYVLLDRVQDPGNIGTIFRTAAAAGCRGLFLTEGTADPFSDKAVRSSMGSILRIPVSMGLTLDDVKKLKKISSLDFYGTALKNAVDYKKAPVLSNVLLAFGNEGQGISDDILQLMDQNLFIPLAGTVESLNVTAAAAVILFYFKK